MPPRHPQDAGAPLARRIGFSVLLALLVLVLAGLGAWQVERRAWKLALIGAVEQRVHAPAGPAPGPAAWPEVTATQDEYRHVTVSGTWLPVPETRVQALTERGAGSWALAALRTDSGWTVLVNRGFVPAERRAPAATGPATVTGLLRMSEPGGGFLRVNDPGADRWYSRDVAAIAAARGLGTVAPYFIDAAGGPDPAALPVGGLTVVAFRNEHLSYALTWFALAGLGVFGLVLLWRRG